MSRHAKEKFKSQHNHDQTMLYPFCFTTYVIAGKVMVATQEVRHLLQFDGQIFQKFWLIFLLTSNDSVNDNSLGVICVIKLTILP